MKIIAALVCLMSGSANAQLLGDLDWVHAAVGAKFKSNLDRRGATYYDAWQVSPIIYLGFFDNRLQFLVSQLDWVDSILKNSAFDLRYRVGAGQFSDEPLFETNGEKKGIRNSRPTTYEAGFSLEWFFFKYGEVIFRIFQDLRAHNGQYFENEYRVNLGRYPLGTEVLPQLFFKYGYGSKDHNTYLFGPEGSSGISHYAGGLQIQLPELYDRHFPALQLFAYRTVSEENRAGRLLDGKRQGVQLNVTFAIGVL